MATEAPRGNISGLSVSPRPSSGRTADGFVITFSGRSMNLAAVGGAKAPALPALPISKITKPPPQYRTGFGPILVLRLENRCASVGHRPALRRAPGKPDHFQTISRPPGVFAVVQFAAEAQRRREPNSDRRGPKLVIRHQLAHRDTPPGPCFSNLTASRN